MTPSGLCPVAASTIAGPAPTPAEGSGTACHDLPPRAHRTATKIICSRTSSPGASAAPDTDHFGTLRGSSALQEKRLPRFRRIWQLKTGGIRSVGKTDMLQLLLIVIAIAWSAAAVF